MRQAVGDMMRLDMTKIDALVVTTNGFVKRDGSAVMGRGIAKQAAEQWPWLPMVLGQAILNDGPARVHVIEGIAPCTIVAFPVKPGYVVYNGENVVRHMAPSFQVGDMVPGWAAKAELRIIKNSAMQLRLVANCNGWTKVALPRPGCGAGELKWELVEPILQQFLDERFCAFNFCAKP